MFVICILVNPVGQSHNVSLENVNLLIPDSDGKNDNLKKWHLVGVIFWNHILEASLWLSRRNRNPNVRTGRNKFVIEPVSWKHKEINRQISRFKMKTQKTRTLIYKNWWGIKSGVLKIFFHVKAGDNICQMADLSWIRFP